MLPSGVRLLGAACSQARASVGGLDQRVDVRPWLTSSGATLACLCGCPPVGKRCTAWMSLLLESFHLGFSGIPALERWDSCLLRLERQRLID